MLVLRLQRVGKKGQPSYRVAVSERRSKLTATPVEDLGSYRIKTKTGAFKKERILHWLRIGAKPSTTVHNLLVTHGIISAPKKRLRIRAAGKETEPAAADPTKVGNATA